MANFTEKLKLVGINYVGVIPAGAILTKTTDNNFQRMVLFYCAKNKVDPALISDRDMEAVVCKMSHFARRNNDIVPKDKFYFWFVKPTKKEKSK